MPRPGRLLRAGLGAGLIAAGGLLLVGLMLARRPMTVGERGDGSALVATSQVIRPAGDTVTFGGRPIDLAVSPDGKTIFLKDDRGLVRVDAASWKVAQEISFPKEGGGSLHGIAVSRDGRRVWATGAQSMLWEATVRADGSLAIARGIPLPGRDGKEASYPCGIAPSPDEKTLYICLSRSNRLAVVDLDAGKVTAEIPVGVAPFDVAVAADGRTAWVSDWGGRRPKDGERTAPSAGTETLVDERGVAASGAVSLVNLTENQETAQVAVGLHPSDITLSPDGRTLFVANANDDTVSVVDTASRSIRETAVVKSDPSLPFGSAPNALCLSPEGKTLYVACGGSNAVAVIVVGDGQIKSRVNGWIPAAWYPGAVALDGSNLFIANVKGLGSRGRPTGAPKGWNVYQYAGAVSRVSLPDGPALKRFTRQVMADARVPEALRARERARTGQKAEPVPVRDGEPSVFEHVVYIIKENRAYDQMLGDLKQGNGDPSLTLYGRDITPNHHALAEQFVLLDNYYCNGVLSADGHSWATEGNVTDHLEKAFGGFTRSYTFGDDPLTYSSSGFLWDNVLAHGLSFRNYGEMDYTDETPNVSYAALYADWRDKTGKISFKHRIGIDRLRRYSAPEAPGWNMDIPDVVRADVFLRDLKRFEERGSFPNLVIVYLPNDHTTGTTPGDPTPNSYLADNDLALGRVVEGISKSKFWPKTCIFVTEDDPQDGFDHVDGHRSLCLIASPYTRRGVVVSEFYNQTSVLHTIERMLGIPPMNQMDAMAPVMAACFQDKPDLLPYTCLPNKVPLAQLNPPKTALSPAARRLAELSERLDFRHVDAAGEDDLNRILWHAAKGMSAHYPAHLVASHPEDRRGRRQDPD